MKLCDDAIHCGCSDLMEKESKRLEWLIDNLEWANFNLAMLSSKQKNWRIAIDKEMENGNE